MGRVYVGRFKEGKLKHRVLLSAIEQSAALPVLLYERFVEMVQEGGDCGYDLVCLFTMYYSVEGLCD